MKLKRFRYAREVIAHHNRPRIYFYCLKAECTRILVMWFAQATGPLGTYVRTRWMFVFDIGKCLVERGPYYGSIKVLSKRNLDDVVVLSSLDPDLVDVLLSSDTECAFAIAYA